MLHDDKQYHKSLFIGLAWSQKLEEQIPALVNKVEERFGVKIEPEYFSLGSFNCCYRLKGIHCIARLPIFCKSAFRYEKTNDECAIMTYVSRHTSIPVPKLIAAESCDLGPYLILSFEEGSLLSESLKASPKPTAPMVLRPDIDTAILCKAYRNMAKVLVELSRCKFSHIGAVGQDDSGRCCVKKRAVTINMNQLVSCGNYPPDELPRNAFATANEYFTALAQTHIIHLRTQRNHAVTDEADFQRKYVARHLFLRIAWNYSTTYNHGPFPLYCDDLRPSNVLVDSDLNIRSVIDWEYCYAAPAEMTYCSPWWLLLRHPDDWKDGDLSSFVEQYLPRQQVFLKVLQAEENEMIQHGNLFESERLSRHMEQSLENGQFWFCLAATSSFGFDDIYWKFIDPVHYGEFTSIEDRIGLLSQQERDDLEPFVQLKMQQREDTELEEHRSFNEMFYA